MTAEESSKDKSTANNQTWMLNKLIKTFEGAQGLNTRPLP